MKKIAAILFILILAFNFCGYRFLISYLEVKADLSLELKIDSNNYDESQLVEMRLPMNMPYQERYTDFERHYGEITIDGKAYTYVKRKIEGDILVLKCIANESKQQLKNTEDILTRANSGQDQQNANDKQTASIIKLMKSDFEKRDCFIFTAITNKKHKNNFSAYTVPLQNISLTIPHQPPRNHRFMLV